MTLNDSWLNRMRTNDLAVILSASLFIRLLAVLFSRGFGMHDDHFLVIEAAQSWVDNTDYNNWLPKPGQVEPTPSGHSFFYVGIHYLLLLFLQFTGINDPQTKMVVIRLIHALYSMITVYYGYKIAGKLGGNKAAQQVGWLLGLFWFWPFLCVRNLVEVVCIPVVVLATWLAVKDNEGKALRYFMMGILLGLAFNIRFQCFLFAFGFGATLLFQKKITACLACAAGFICCAGLVQGLIDYGIWHHPFVEFKEYVRYNLENSENYGSGPWYNYLLLISGILIPPISLFLMFGFFSAAKKHLIVFLPSFVFLVFHSYFPNKQERFIIPIIPFIITLGVIGWNAFFSNSQFWKKRQGFIKYAWIFFWSLNIIPLVVLSVSYSKKNRVEAMDYLRKRGDVSNLLIDDSNSAHFIMSPNYYLGKWVDDYGITKTVSMDMVYANYSIHPPEKWPNYALFYQEKNLVARLTNVMKYHEVEYLTTITPSFIDNLMFKLNPRNKNQTTFIFKISDKKMAARP